MNPSAAETPTLTAPRFFPAGLAALALAALSCTGASDAPLRPSSRTGGAGSNPQCPSLPLPVNSTQVRKDGIPALSNPAFVDPSDPGAAYVSDTTRVVGVVAAGTPLAVPLNIWWHEVVNVSFERDDLLNPYADDWRLDAPPAFETRLTDPRRPPKEVVLGIPDAEWPPGFDAPSGPLRFRAEGDGYRDHATGSLWTLEGTAVEGPAAGARLVRHPRAFVAFWFAWSVLRPEMEILTAG